MGEQAAKTESTTVEAPERLDGEDPIPEEAHARAEELAKALLSMPPRPRTRVVA